MGIRSLLAGPAVLALAAATLTTVAPLGSAEATETMPLPDGTACSDERTVVRHGPSEGVHNHPLWDSYYDLAPFGFQEQEYFISGTAVTDSGTSSAQYTTRFILTMPTAAVEGDDIVEFNGSVLVDWTNVTAQFENAVDTMSMREELMRSGYGYVHVSAQLAGTQGIPLALKQYDPIRYAAIAHPGDEYAQDMFRQVADAVRCLAGADTIIAAGQSQSGSRLSRYVQDYLSGQLAAGNDVRDSIDAIIVHGSQAGGKRALAAAADELGVKVLHLLADSEANPEGGALLGDGTLADIGANDFYRLWEIAGAAHADFWIGYQSEFGHGPRTLVDAPQVSPAKYAEIIRSAGHYGAQLHPLYAVCIAAGAAMPMHYATNTALTAVDAWAQADGVAPPNGPRYEFDTVTGQLARDEFGNAKGGIRLPAIDVPMAEYRSTDCGLGGITRPFTDVEVRALHPTFGDYWAAMAQASQDAVDAGWLLPVDAADQMARVCSAKVRWPEAATEECPAFELA